MFTASCGGLLRIVCHMWGARIFATLRVRRDAEWILQHSKLVEAVIRAGVRAGGRPAPSNKL